MNYSFINLTYSKDITKKVILANVTIILVHIFSGQNIHDLFVQI